MGQAREEGIGGSLDSFQNFSRAEWYTSKEVLYTVSAPESGSNSSAENGVALTPVVHVLLLRESHW